MPRREYVVTCTTCKGDLLTSLYYDVAERFADRHTDETGHDTDVVELPASDVEP